MKHFLLALLFVIGCRLALADEPNLKLTVDGVTYSDVTFGAVTPYAVKIRHSTGIASIPLAKLSPDLQQRFDYDPQKAADFYQKSQAQEAAARVQADAAYKRSQQIAARQELIAKSKAGTIVVAGQILQISPNGAYISDAFTTRSYQVREEIPPQPNHTLMEGERTFVTRTQSENIRVTVEGEPIFVIGAGNGLIDGADWQGRIYPAGRHRYNSVGGSVKTVLCFATSPEAAADYLLKNR